METGNTDESEYICKRFALLRTDFGTKLDYVSLFVMHTHATAGCDAYITGSCNPPMPIVERMQMVSSLNGEICHRLDIGDPAVADHKSRTAAPRDENRTERLISRRSPVVRCQVTAGGTADSLSAARTRMLAPTATSEHRRRGRLNGKA